MKSGFSRIIFSGLIAGGLFAGSFAFAQTAQMVIRDRFYLQAQENARSFTQQIDATRETLIKRLESERVPITKALESIKDLAKRQAAQDIIDETQAINLGWTNYYADSLNQLDLIMAKVKSRREKARLEGKDITGSSQAISEADSAIAKARQDLLTQAGRMYLPNITNTKNPVTVSLVRNELKINRDNLLSDYINFKEGRLQTARTKVVDAIKVMSIITPN